MTMDAASELARMLGPVQIDDFAVQNCPTCGSYASGLIELARCRIRVVIHRDGRREHVLDRAFEFQPETAQPEIVDGECTLTCPNGHEWKSRMAEDAS